MGVIIADGRRLCARCEREPGIVAWADPFSVVPIEPCGLAARAARAKREALAAEQQRLEAEHSRAQAQDLHDRADEVDPDADLDRDEKAGDRRA